MKVKAELDLTVEMGGVSHDNTGCQGDMTEVTTYYDYKSRIDLNTILIGISEVNGV
jgi:hypothetical protein